MREVFNAEWRNVQVPLLLAFAVLAVSVSRSNPAQNKMNSDFHAENDLPQTFSGRLADKLLPFGVSPKKAVEYLCLFVVLTVIYYCYFVRDAQANMCPVDDTVTFARLGVLILKFFVFTSWPFVLAAAFDSEWTGKDAGNLFLAAYLFTNVLWYHKTHCAFCIFAASFRIIPYVFCAMIAHGLGTLRHRANGKT
jgi:hypothetical protein